LASLVTVDGTTIELTDGETLIGRGERDESDPPKVNVGPLVGGATVSRHHARVVRVGGQWYLRVEHEARNPTLVGGRRIPVGEETLLADDTSIQLGDLVLRFSAPDVGRRSDETMIESSDLVVPDLPPTPVPLPTPVAPVPEQIVVVAPPPTVEWPARLPDRPAVVGAIGVSEFKRVNPFRGLMIDENAWADAHEYHRTLARLHLLSGHGWGTVEGLEVVADLREANALIVRPGVAIDPHGYALVVGQERRVVVTAGQGATVYVTARRREELASPQRYWSDQDEYTRLIEKCEILLQATPPVAPAVELARVTISGPLRNAVDVLDPRVGEIDLRFRERLAIRPRPDLAVAELAVQEESLEDPSALRHRLGLRYLMRELSLTTTYRARWAGVVRLGDPIPAVSLLYLSGSRGFQVGSTAQARLQQFLQGGGVIFADGCQGEQAVEFAASVQTLATALGRQLQPVERWHPLLTARHVFSEPPLGSPDHIALAEGDRIILSTADYGCAWQGGTPDHPLPRETIRAALEFGTNVLVYARQRQRPLEALDND